eukprot:4000026-Amphidinium_carterae.1
MAKKYQQRPPTYVESSKHIVDNYQNKTNEGNHVVWLRPSRYFILRARKILNVPPATTFLSSSRGWCLKVNDMRASNLRTCPDPTTSMTNIIKGKNENKTTQVHWQSQSKF